METALDIEWIHAIAPGANILLVESNSQSLADLITSAAMAASQPGVSVVSMSWGFAERQTISAHDEAMFDSYLTTPAGHQGVTFVASTGDYGSRSAEYPAFSPNVLAVGGTSLNLNADGSYGKRNRLGVRRLVGKGNRVRRRRWRQSIRGGADVSTGGAVHWVADEPRRVDGGRPVDGGLDCRSIQFARGQPLGRGRWHEFVGAVMVGIDRAGQSGPGQAGQATLNSAGPTETQQALYNLPMSAFHDITTGTNGGYTQEWVTIS